MPEIGEIARVVKLINSHAAGRIIRNIIAHDDTIIFKDTTAAAFKSALEGRKIREARQWGKYFWIVMDQSPHPLMHFGMTGWIHIKSNPAGHYRAETNAPTEWPPRFTKFILNLDNSDSLAFVDARRLARIRLISSPNGNLRPLPPLSENGPDPYIEPPTLEQVTSMVKKRKIPVKALLLDQSVMAGIGNWVADEILFQARLYPEVYTNVMSKDQIKRLREKVVEVVKVAVETDAEMEKFPENWLMKHRWGKGKKDGNWLPTGEKVEFLKVGGRTTAYVPSLQKRNEGEKVEDGEEAEEEKPKKRARGKAIKVEKIPKEEEEEVSKGGVEHEVKTKRRGRPKKVKEESEDPEEDLGEDDEDDEPAPKKRKATSTLKKTANGVEKKVKTFKAEITKKDDTPKSEDDLGRRRSTRRKK